MFRRKPDVVIGDNYLERWYIIPRNKYLNIYLHRFRGSDEDRAHHDHPWHSISFKLRGTLEEQYKGYWDCDVLRYKSRDIKNFLPYYRSRKHKHRLELHSKDAVTLFITGPRKEDGAGNPLWGFWCRKGFVPWQDFVDPDNYGKIGAGCGEE